jgi:replicative DNA helicase
MLGTGDLLPSRTPPQSLELEQNVLGSLLLDNETFPFVEAVLRPEHFYKEAHRKIYTAITRLIGRGEPADLATLAEELRQLGQLEAVGSVPYLIGLADSVPTAAYVETYARKVREKALLRDLISICGQVMQTAFDGHLETAEIIDRAERAVLELQLRTLDDEPVPMSQVMSETADYVRELYTAEGTFGLPTGLKKLDELTGGLNKGEMSIWGARPSMGKSALAFGIGLHVTLKEGKTALAFSLEAKRKTLGLRMTALEGFVDLSRIRNRQLSDRDWERLTNTMNRLGDAKLFTDDSPYLTIRELRSKSRRLHSRFPLDLIIVDYLQLIEPEGNHGTREREVASMSRALKQLAMELDCHVMVLSQLSRAVEARPNKRPMLSDLRESGAVEQDADLVAFIYRDEYYDPNSEKEGVAELIVGKQRNGPIGTVEVAFIKRYTAFRDLGLF